MTPSVALIPAPTQPEGAHIYYSPFMQDDKHFFSAYFNLAQNNIQEALQEFKRRVGSQNNSTGAQIFSDYFRPNLSFHDWERGINLLRSYFPVVSALDIPVEHPSLSGIADAANKEAARRDYFLTHFKALIKAIAHFRNFYSHYQHPGVTVADEGLFQLLDNLLLDTVKDVKKQRFKTDKTKLILKRNLEKELSDKLTEEKARQDAKKTPGRDRPEQILNSVLNDAFKHLLFKEESGSLLLKDRVKAKFAPSADFTPELIIPFSRSGILLLLALFLSRKETEDLMGKLEGYKRNDELRYIATRWVYSSYCFKGLKHTVSTAFTRETLLTQIVDELSKVPHAQYQLLSQTDKDEFLEDWNEYVKDNAENEENLENSRVIHPVIRKRYEDRFAYFALRFLDEFAGFGNLRFQVRVGNYVHHSEVKQIKGINLVTDRVIRESVRVFGNLTEVAKLKSEFFERINRSLVGSAYWEEFPNPSYAIAGNNIGISFLNPQRLSAIAGFKKQHSKNEERIAGSGKKLKEDIWAELAPGNTVKPGEPIAYLSLNELPSLLHQLLVEKKTGAALENIIMEKIYSQFSQLKDSAPGMPVKNIPKKLRKEHPGFNWDKLTRNIGKDINETEEKLELIAHNRAEIRETLRRGNKPRKAGEPNRRYVFFTRELGEEATWLAEDFKRSMSKELRQGWKGYQHSELQRVIAYYPSNKEQLISFLEANLDMRSAWGKDVMDIIGRRALFEDFYTDYLQQRKSRLRALLMVVKDNGLEPKIKARELKKWWSFYDEGQYQPIQAAQRLTNILTKPINLPRGLFDDKPSYIRGLDWAANKERFAGWLNYFREQDSYQSFYALTPCWSDKQVAELVAARMQEEAPAANKKGLTAGEKLDYVKRKLLKEAAEQQKGDVFLKLMADHIYARIFGSSFDASLADLYQTRAERQEHDARANAQNRRQAGDRSENIRNERFVWNRNVRLALCGGRIVEPAVKLKEVGKFRKLEGDSRVATMLKYDNRSYSAYLDPQWNAGGHAARPTDVISEQMAAYEQARSESLLRETQCLEKLLLQQQGCEPERFRKGGHPSFRRYIAYGILERVAGADAAEAALLAEMDMENIDAASAAAQSGLFQKAYVLVLLRNKFAHNQLPSEDQYRLIRRLYPEPDTVGIFAWYFDGVVRKIIAELRSLLPPEVTADAL